MCANFNANLLKQIQAAHGEVMRVSEEDVTVKKITFLPGVVIIEGDHASEPYFKGWLTDYIVQGCRVKLSVKKEGEKNAN